MVYGMDSNMIASTSFSYAMTQLYRTMKDKNESSEKSSKVSEIKKKPCKNNMKSGDKNNNRIKSHALIKQQIKHLIAKIDAFV